GSSAGAGRAGLGVADPAVADPAVADPAVADPAVDDTAAATSQTFAPSVTITSPAPGATFARSPQLPGPMQRLEIAAEAAGLGAGARVTLYVDDRVIAIVDRPPYRALWRLAVGEHVVRAVSTDAGGGRVASEPVAFTVLEREPQAAALAGGGP
ncbi:MAG: Ig-like domain-containing protein, partial [Ardenticatenales bacterium]